MVEAAVSGAAMNLPHLANGIAVASGKGGVGKTWLSVTLCQILARQGRNVLLFDGDLGLANVDIQLGLAPEKDLGGVLAGKYTLDQAISHCREGSFDVIAGRSGSGIDSMASSPRPKISASEWSMSISLRSRSSNEMPSDSASSERSLDSTGGMGIGGVLACAQ